MSLFLVLLLLFLKGLILRPLVMWKHENLERKRKYFYTSKNVSWIREWSNMTNAVKNGNSVITNWLLDLAKWRKDVVVTWSITRVLGMRVWLEWFQERRWGEVKELNTVKTYWRCSAVQWTLWLIDRLLCWWSKGQDGEVIITFCRRNGQYLMMQRKGELQNQIP